MSRPKPPAQDWQAEIYARHQYWITGKPVHMAVGDGWADVVARLFDRIEKALTGEPVPTKIALIDVKEKYASLRADLLTPVGPRPRRRSTAPSCWPRCGRNAPAASAGRRGWFARRWVSRSGSPPAARTIPMVFRPTTPSTAT